MNTFTRLQKMGLAAGLAATILLAALAPGRTQQDGQEHGLGMILPAPHDFDRYPALKISLRDPTPIPDRFTLEAYLPPIGNQGKTGSCVGWSTAYYCYSISVARQRKLTDEERKQNKFLFAPGWIWNQFNEGDSEHGMQIFQAFDVLEKMGCATLAEYPWEEKALPFHPSETAQKKAEFYKARQTLVLFRGQNNGDPADPEQMRHWLAESKTPIVMGIPIYDDFPRGTVSEDYIYDRLSSTSKLRGYHAVCIIGYDRPRRAFELVNSWGENWGNHGKLWLSESFLKDYAIQGCVQAPGGPRIRGMQIKVPASSGEKPTLR